MRKNTMSKLQHSFTCKQKRAVYVDWKTTPDKGRWPIIIAAVSIHCQNRQHKDTAEGGAEFWEVKFKQTTDMNIKIMH